MKIIENCKRMISYMLMIAILFNLININFINRKVYGAEISPYRYSLVVAYFEYYEYGGKYRWQDSNGDEHVLCSVGQNPNGSYIDEYRFPVALMGNNYEIESITNLKNYKGNWEDLNYSALPETEVKRHYMDSAVINNSSRLEGEKSGTVWFESSFYPLSDIPDGNGRTAKEKKNVWRSYVAVVVKYVDSDYVKDPDGWWKDHGGGGTDPEPEPPQGEVNADLELDVPSEIEWNYKEYENDEYQRVRVRADARDSTSTLDIEEYDFEVEVGSDSENETNDDGYMSERYKVYPSDVRFGQIPVQARVTVTDEDGNSDTAYATDSIRVSVINEPPNAYFINSDRNYATVPMSVIDNSSDPEDDLVFIQWRIRNSDGDLICYADLDLEDSTNNDIDFTNSYFDSVTFDENGANLTFKNEGYYQFEQQVWDIKGKNDTYIKTIYVNKRPLPPTANFDMLEFGYPNESISVTDTSTDPNNDIVSWEWTKPIEASGSLSGSGGNITFINEGEYPVKLKVTDYTNLTDEITKMIKIIPPLPVARIEVGGTLKENREVIIHSKNSLSPRTDPIQVDRNEWSITPLDGQDPQSVKIDTDTSNNEEKHILFKEPGKYKVWLRVHNKFSDDNPQHEQIDAIETEEIINIGEDLKPIADMTIDGATPNFNDNPIKTTVNITDSSYSTDGDIINHWYWTIWRDDNENGDFSDDDIYGTYTDITDFNMDVQFEQGNSGLFKAELSVKEEFGQPTIDKFVSDGDRRTNTTTKIFDVNWQPDISFDLPDWAYTDDTLNISTVIKDEEIDTTTVVWTIKRANETNTSVMDSVSISTYTDNFLNNSGGPIRFTQSGFYELTATITDEKGLSYSYSDTIRIYPLPTAVIKDDSTLRWQNQEFNTKENRKYSLNGNSSFANDYYGTELHPIEHSKDYWEIIPLENQGAGVIKIQNGSGGALISQGDSTKFVRNNDDFNETLLFKDDGRYKVRYQVTNSHGKKSPFAEQIITVAKDTKPDISFDVIPTAYRNADDSKRAELISYNIQSSSNDEDIIDIERIRYRFDSDNDGDFSDESWIGNVAIDKKQKRATIKASHVGNYQFEYFAKDKYGQPTLDEFVTANDRLENYKYKIIEIDNIAPTVDFQISPENKVDIVFTIGEVDNNKVKELNSKINTYIKTKLESENTDLIDASIEMIETNTISTDDADAEVIFTNWEKFMGNSVNNSIEWGYIPSVTKKESEFDGYKDIQVFHPSRINSNFTYEFVAKPTATNTILSERLSGDYHWDNGQRIILAPNHGGSDGTKAGIGISLGTNGLSVIAHAHCHWVSLLSYYGDLSDEHRYSLVIKNDTPYLYIDGTLVKKGIKHNRTLIGTVEAIGGHAYGAYIGNVKDFRFWNKALTSTEVSRSITETLNGNENNLIGYWKLNKEEKVGSGAKVKDFSPTNREGTINLYGNSEYGGSIYTTFNGSFSGFLGGDGNDTDAEFEFTTKNKIFGHGGDKSSDDDNYGWLFRYDRASQTGYAFIIDGGGSNDPGLYKMNGSYPGYKVANINEALIQDKDWHNWRVKVQGGNIKIWKENSLICDWTDSNPIQKGKYGTFAYSQAYVYFKNLKITTGTIKTLDSVLKEPTWRENSTKFIVNISDKELAELNDPEKYPVILTRLMNDNLYFAELGTNTNRVQAQNLISDNSSKGTFIYNNNPDMNKALQELADYILNVVRTEKNAASKYILLDEEMHYTVFYNDLEEDPKYNSDNWKYVHDENYFDNSLGKADFNNIWLSDSVKIFNKTGKYTVEYKTKDNPSADDRFSEYRKWSSMMNGPLDIYVHRKPIASFIPKITKVNTEADKVYMQTDIDFYGEGGRYAEWEPQFDAAVGKIKKIEFETPYANDDYWYNTTGNLEVRGWKNGSWHVIKSYLSSFAGKSDKISDTINVEGQGYTKVKFFFQMRDSSKSAEGNPDGAYYKITTSEERATGFTVTYTDNSYDIDHTSRADKGIVDREWAWKEVGQSTWNSGQLINGQTTKDYLVKLRVRDMDGENGLGVWSDETVILITNNALPPIAQFTLSTNVLPIEDNLSITDSSYDPNGDTIVQWEWKLYKDNNLIKTYTTNTPQSQVNTDINTNGIGEYKLTLQVRDNTGTWGDPRATSEIYTQNFKVIPVNHKPNADFNPASDESPSWVFPKTIGNMTMLFRPTKSVFHEEKVRFNEWATDPDSDNTGFDYHWTFERYKVKDLSDIGGTPDSIYTFSTKTPFVGSFKSNGLPWGAYKITLKVTDKPPVPPYQANDKQSVYVTKELYVIPEISMSAGFEHSGAEILVGDTITLRANTSKEVETVTCELEGNTVQLNKVSEDSTTITWEKDFVIPDNIETSGTYQLKFKAQTVYGGSSSATREIIKNVPIDLIALKLINYRVTDIVNHKHLTFPITKDMLETNLIEYKTGYYVTFRINSKGKPSTVEARIDIRDDKSVDQTLSLNKVGTSGTEEVWEGKFYTEANLPNNTIISMQLIARKNSTSYNYNTKENWNGRVLIVKGSALQDARINLTN